MPTCRTIKLSCTFFLTIALATTACSGTGENAATAQARQSTVDARATRMARALHSTEVARLVQMTATAEAWRDELRQVERWPLFVQDSFDDNSLEWLVGEESGEYADVRWEIKDGKYFWKATAKQGFIWWMRAEMEHLTDFYVAVDARQVSGPESGQVGLVFRQSADDSYHTFTLRNDGTFSLDWSDPDGWTSLIDWTPSDAIKVGATNRIGVWVQAERINLFINDQWVDSYTTTYSPSGTVAIFICLDNEGDEGVFEFDNFELRLLEMTSQ